MRDKTLRVNWLWCFEIKISDGELCDIQYVVDPTHKKTVKRAFELAREAGFVEPNFFIEPTYDENLNRVGHL